MHVRLIPYSEIFVSVTLSLDEAVTLSDSLSVVAKEMPSDVQCLLKTLHEEIEAAMVRAHTMLEKRDG